MHQQTLVFTYGALLHNLDRPLQRSGAKTGLPEFLGEFPLPEGVCGCVRDARSADAAAGAALVRFAARLPAEGAQANPYAPLQSVFTHLNGEHPGLFLPLQVKTGMPVYPGAAAPATANQYKALMDTFRQGMHHLSPGEAGINDLLNLMEDCFSFVPSGFQPDLSLYDHSKLAAAMAACLSEYALATGTPASPEEAPAFLLYSADFSGIQKFIFTVATKGALASLRSRSFFLELLMEHYMDELLTACGVSRANLLYSGGGHCYLLLPNTPAAEAAAKKWNLRFNDWLLEEFGPLLFIAHGYAPCCMGDLTNANPAQERYTALFRNVSAAISTHKLCRYTPAQIRRINSGSADHTGRECQVCGRSDRLNEQNLCFWCALFRTLSPRILEEDVFLISREEAGSSFSLPAFDGQVHIALTDIQSVRNYPGSGETLVRIYEKNRQSLSLPGSIRLYVGDYAPEREMHALTESARGIRRLAVCRMDVDNLGTAFTTGYRIGGEADSVKRDRYLNLSRTSAFSRQMSLFFKGYINAILAAPGEDGTPLAVAIVYSGGDDVFLVGAWDAVLTAARRIRDAFTAFCGGSLTLSAGISLHRDSFPIRIAAGISAELEELAKSQPGKNALSLFDAASDQTYSWTVFQEKVLGEKLPMLESFFAQENQERGNSFLYQILDLLRLAQTGKIHLARYAYLLARMEPRETYRKEQYLPFSRAMYRWALPHEDRRQLITAIYLYIYMQRKEN